MGIFNYPRIACAAALTAGLLQFGPARALDLAAPLQLGAQVRSAISAEPFGLQLNGVMTFFFSVYYFQYHFSRIIGIKRSRGQIV